MKKNIKELLDEKRKKNRASMASKLGKGSKIVKKQKESARREIMKRYQKDKQKQ